MREIQSLGVRETGHIDKRYGAMSTKSFSLFECPVCLKQYEIATSRGKKQTTCVDCRGTQKVTHGFAGKRAYTIWQGMKQRCNNPETVKFHLYGGKGIKVDPTWDTFENFWSDMGDTYGETLTIDRVDSSKDYCKSNCRWITLSRNSSETTKRRPVIQFRVARKPTIEYIPMQEYESALKAAEALGLTAAHITAVCKGKRKTHGGFAWAYK